MPMMMEWPVNRFAKLVLAASALGIALSAPARAFEPVAIIEGETIAKDGDGLLFGEIEVRMQGIAAPEYRSNRKDRGGLEALDALAELANGRVVRCDLDGTTANRRPVGVCHLDDLDLNTETVRLGVARDCPAYSGGRHDDEERQAREAGSDLSRIYPLPDYC
jgi:micrococcal nuclease